MLRIADLTSRFPLLSAAALLVAAMALPGCSDDAPSDSTKTSGDGAKADGGGSGDKSTPTKTEQSAAPKKSGASPDDMFQALNGLLDGNDPAKVWRLMPESYHKDVNGLISEFAGKMDPQLWNKGFALFAKITKVLDEKGEFILGYPMVQMMTAQSDPDELKTGLAGVAKTFSAIANSDLKTLDGLKNLNVESFLSTTVGSTVKDLLATASTVGGAMGESDLPEKMGIAILSESADTAVVEVTKADGTKEEVPMAKVEGKWIPKEMATDWAKSIEDAHKSLAGLTITEDDKAGATMMFGMVEQFLDKMLQAEEQEDFNDTVDSITQMMGGMAGGGMGG